MISWKCPAFWNCPDSVIHVLQRADENYWDVTRVLILFQPFADLEAIHLRHPHIQTDQLQRLRQGRINGQLWVIGRTHLVTFPAKQLGQQLKVGHLIVDDGDIVGSGLFISVFRHVQFHSFPTGPAARPSYSCPPVP